MTLTKPKYFIGIILLLIVIIYAIPDSYSKGERMMHLSTSNHVMVVPIPDDIQLAGEKMPDKQSNQELLSREMQVNSFWHSNTIQLLQKSGRYFPIIEPILESEGVPNDFKYLAVIESGLAQVVSPAGATGIWQMLETTARDYNLEVNEQIDERYHIVKSTLAACKYLNEAKKKFGSWTLAAASYNMGMAGLQKQLKRQEEKNYYDLLLNEETKRYIYRILAIKYIFQEPRSFGFDLFPSDYMKPWDDVLVYIDSSVGSWGNFAHKYGWSYKELKNHNPWLRESYLINKYQKKYGISVPQFESSPK